MRCLSQVVGAVLLVALSALPACRRAAPSPTAATQPDAPPDLVLITLDTTRADHLGCYGYFRDTSPQIDAFAKACIVFDRCIAPMATTLPTHASIFTGVYPLEHGVVCNVRHGGRPFTTSPSLRSYAQILQEAGYQTGGFISAMPLKRVSGINVGFDAYDEPNAPQRPSGDTLDVALAWLKKTDDRPLFLWVHYYDPHAPYAPPPPYNRMFTDDATLQEHVAARQFAPYAPHESGLVAASVPSLNLYDGEVRYMDGEVGRLLDELRQRARWAETVVVLVGDHGEGLGQHGQLGHGYIWDEQVHVPLMLRVPGQSPRRVATTISVVDVLPTVLGLVPQLPRGSFLDQVSGWDVLAADHAPHPIFSQQTGRDRPDLPGDVTALTTAEWKYVRLSADQEQLFERRTDPYELRDVSAAQRDVVEQLRAALLAQQAEMVARGKEFDRDRTDRKLELTPREMEALRSLGYVP